MISAPLCLTRLLRGTTVPRQTDSEREEEEEEEDEGHEHLTDTLNATVFETDDLVSVSQRPRREL